MVSSLVIDSSTTLPDLSGDRFRRFVQTGDAEVLDLLLADWLDRAYTQAFRLLGRRSEAEDAVQEAIIRLVNTAKRYDGSIPFGAWFGRLIHNAALDIMRSTKRRQKREALAGDAEKPGEFDDENVDEEAVRAAVRDLPEAYRAPVDLHYFAGLSQHDTAKALGLSENAVAMRLHRAREFLRGLLARRGIAIAGATAAAILASTPASAAPASLLVRMKTTSAMAVTTTSSLTGLTSAKAVAFALSAVLIVATAVAVRRSPTQATPAFVRNWNCDTPEALEGLSWSMSVIPGEPPPYQFNATGGVDGSGCVESYRSCQILVDVAPCTLPLVLRWRVLKTDQTTLFMSRVWWRRVQGIWNAIPEPQNDQSAAKIGQWDTYEAYLTAKWTCLSMNGQRIVLQYVRPVDTSKVIIQTSGAHRLDDLSVRSIDETEIPNLAEIRREVDRAERHANGYE